MAKLSKSELGKRLQSGQALLIVLLGMAVVLTMVLSVVSRSVTDIQLTTRDDEALRAFSAAEAGVEQALVVVGSDIGETTFADSGSSYSVVVEKLAEGDQEYVYPEEIYSGESGTLWFVSHNSEGDLSCMDEVGKDNPCFSGNSLTVCWAKESTIVGGSPPAPAMEVLVYYDARPSTDPSPLGASPDYGDVQVARFTFDPDGGRTSDNNFSGVNPTGCDFEGQTMEFSANVALNTGLPVGPPNCSSVEGCLLFAKAKLIYNDTVPHPVGFMAGNLFPSQGVFIESTGQFGDSTRQIEVFRTYNEPLSIFDSAIFSMGSKGDLVKE